MMNIKKIFILLLFLVAIIGIVAPVNAVFDGSVGYTSTKVVNGKTSMSLFVASNVGTKELNTINKISVKVKGYKAVTFKKPAKGWDVHGTHFDKKFTLNEKQPKNVNKKDYSIKFYDKKNKLLKDKRGKVTSHAPHSH